MTEDTFQYILESKTDGTLFQHGPKSYLAVSNDQEVSERFFATFNTEYTLPADLIPAEHIEAVLSGNPGLEVIDLDDTLDSDMTAWEFQQAIKEIQYPMSELDSRVNVLDRDLD